MHCQFASKERTHYAGSGSAAKLSSQTHTHTHTLIELIYRIGGMKSSKTYDEQLILHTLNLATIQC
jgi:hypothetical protein